MAKALISTVPSGAIAPYGGTVAPAGYLLCDGTIKLRSDFPALFNAIGTAFGAGNNDGLTFHLPDTRGIFLRGVDGSKGFDPDKASRSSLNSGGNSGNAVGSFQSDMFAAHSHTYPVGEGSINSNGPNPEGTAVPPTQYTGGTTGGNETRPKNVNVNYIIKI